MKIIDPEMSHRVLFKVTYCMTHEMKTFIPNMLHCVLNLRCWMASMIEVWTHIMVSLIPLETVERIGSGMRHLEVQVEIR